MNDIMPPASPVAMVAKPGLTIRFGDHLFIDGDTNHLNDQHRGIVQVTDADKASWRRIVDQRWLSCHEKGIPFLFVLAPDKQTVYRHLLPSEYQYRQAIFFTEHPCVVDPAPVLAAAAKLVDVYPRTDSHWNHLGAFMTAQMVQARLGRNFPDIIAAWVEHSKSGDLGHKVEPQETSLRLHAKLNSTSTFIYDNLVPNNGRIRIHAKSLDHLSEAHTCLVIFGDSFSYDLVHFLKEVFDLVVHVHSFAVDQRIIDAVTPTAVLSEITERFTLRLPIPGDGTPLEALWEQKIRTKTALEPRIISPNPDLTQFSEPALQAVKIAEALFSPFRVRLAGQTL
jgi:hypothetical protein